MAGFDPSFEASLKRLIAAAPKGSITIGSGYRSPERQKFLWERAVKKYGSPEAARHWVAPPGHSMHNKGLAADLQFGPGGKEFAHAHAKEYGLTFRMGHEPWHIEPLPKEGGGSGRDTMVGGKGKDRLGGGGGKGGQRVIAAMNYFMNKGLKPWQAAGLVGNFQAESYPDLRPEAIGDNGSAFGIFQARGSRFTFLKNVAARNGKDWRDFESQLDAAWAELNGPEAATLSKLRRSRNVVEATEAAIGFLRPKGYKAENPRSGHNWSGRLNYAKSIASTVSMGGDSDGQPIYDKAAKDDQIPTSDRNPMDVASEIDFTDSGDMGFGVTSDGFEGLPFEPMPDSPDDGSDTFDFMPDPPGEVAGVATDPFSSLYPPPDDSGIPDPPGPIPDFATFEQLPMPGTRFREVVMGLPSARNPIPKADFGSGEDV